MPQINQVQDLSKTYGPGRASSPVHQVLLGPYAQFPQYNVTMPGGRAERDSLDSGIELMLMDETSPKRVKEKQKQQPLATKDIRLAWSNKVQGETPYDITNLLEIQKKWPRIVKKPMKQLPKKPPFRV